MSIFKKFRATIGIDPGSENLKIMKNSEFVFNEPAQASIGDGEKYSYMRIGKNINQKDRILKPVDYVINDFAGFAGLLRQALNGLKRQRFLESYIIYLAIPTNTSEIEKRAYMDSAEHVGGVEVYMVYQSVAASANMKLLKAGNHYIVIDIGASKVEVTIFSNGIIISDGHIRIGTRKLKSTLKNFILRKYSISLSESEEEELLRSLTKIYSREEITIGFTPIKTSELREVLDHYFYVIKDMINENIEKIRSHREYDKIVSNGIYVIGGGVKVEGLYEKIHPDAHINYQISKNPEVEVINGLKIIMEEKKKYKFWIINNKTLFDSPPF